MNSMRLTAAQATVRYLVSQLVDDGERAIPYFAGVWAIFGHGNVAGLGEALHAVKDVLPTLRAHNEQSMAHAAIAFAKQMRRRRAMICTTSIGPGATNLVTAAALAHVNRLPVLLLPGDVFATRGPDPVLQQMEDFSDGTVSANDSLRPVSRYFDRITRPEQLIDALPRAMATLLDPASCGPVTLALCQDIQTEGWDFPHDFFTPHIWRVRAPRPDVRELHELVNVIRNATAPLFIAGGGVLYSGAEAKLGELASQTGIPLAETQAGKGSLAWHHPLNLGAIGVTGSSAANETAAAADLVIGLGTRLQDFTTGSRSLFNRPDCKLAQVNICAYDAHKHRALSVVGDVGEVITALAEELGGWKCPSAWTEAAGARITRWNTIFDTVTAPGQTCLNRCIAADPPATASKHEPVIPTDAQVLGSVWRHAADNAIVVAAAGGLPGELHKLWRVRAPGGYHVEYGYSCMGYEIAGGLGVKMAAPERDVYVLLGDGSYLMMNSELATSVMLGCKIMIIVLDNHGFGCIHRLQKSTGGEPFNNLLVNATHQTQPVIDFAAHAASLGARAEKVGNLAELEVALDRAKLCERTYVIVIETDANSSTAEGGAWWNVAVPEVSATAAVRRARSAYDIEVGKRRRDK